MIKTARYWMTGCMALVLLAAGRWSLPEENDTSERLRPGWVSAVTPHSLDDTVSQLQQAALRHGLQVLVSLSPTGPEGRMSGDRVLVLARADGHTPVVQSAADDAPGGLELPMKVLVRQMPDGQTQVAYSDPHRWDQTGPLPDDARLEVATLPSVVHSALSGEPARQA